MAAIPLKELAFWRPAVYGTRLPAHGMRNHVEWLFGMTGEAGFGFAGF